MSLFYLYKEKIHLFSTKQIFGCSSQYVINYAVRDFPGPLCGTSSPLCGTSSPAQIESRL